jgi:hypothetical protein
MPRGRPKGSKNKSSSKRKGTATATQLASLVKARAVRAKQIKYFPALPEGGFKALSTPARMSARTAAYKKITKKMLSGANKMMPSIAYGSIRTAYPVSYATGLAKVRKARASKKIADAESKVSSAAKQVVAAVKKVKKAATAAQLAALAKARTARSNKRGDRLMATLAARAGETIYLK